MPDDIVARLRAWIPCYRADTDVAIDIASAADEIERLRARLLAEENVYDILRLENEHLQTDRNNLALEAERLQKRVNEFENKFLLQ